MGLKLMYHIFCDLIVIHLFMCNESEALANGAVYMVKNEGTNQCLTAGPLIKPHGNESKLELFKEGTILSKNCSNISSIAATDFGQQWTIRIRKQRMFFDDSLFILVIQADPTKKLYQIEMVMLNTQYDDPGFHARLRGEFISYFPKLISLKQEAKKNSGDEFLIVNPDTGLCLADEINSDQVKFSKCVNLNLNGKRGNDDGGEEKFQRWNFTLVNEIRITKDRDNRKLSKKPAHHHKWSKEYDWRGNTTPDKV